ncbi:pyridoxal-phosphate dependent enzyme [Nonomuraea sp. NPDC050022]|uniref:pyridoxal-phosphate dependent enzyme n=1 Tax=Nonomuraea sp. NPDC050022 TaxID=3364358 RepID=UPI0037A29F4F
MSAPSTVAASTVTATASTLAASSGRAVLGVRGGSVREELRRLGAGTPPTPLVCVGAEVESRRVIVRLKLEGAGTWGSIKDRTALSLLRSVADRLDVPGAALVESTSGNLGVALASAARALGISFTAVVDPSLSPVLAERMIGLGAVLSEVSRRDAQGGYLSARLDRVAALLAADPALVWTDQYHNPANPLAHYQGTGPELHKQAPGSMDAVFVAVSTGGTLAGLGRYLRQRRPKARVIAVDVPGSRVFADPAGTRLLTGIGASRPSAFLRQGDWDDVVIVDDADAVSHCHALAGTTGIRLGGSSGAVLAACTRYLAEHPEITSPVCVCPDSGGNYTQTLYAPAWLADRGVEVARDLPATFLRREHS